MLLSTVLQVAYPTVRSFFIERSHVVTLAEQGLADFRPLGILVEDADGTRYPIDQLSTRLLWADAQDNIPELDQIGFVADLLEESIKTHEAFFRNLIDQYYVVFSENYYMDLSAIQQQPGFYTAKIYSFYAKLPKRG